MRAIIVETPGGPENLKLTDLPSPEPKQGEVLVKLERIGVNFIDVYFRKGFYKAPESPIRIGQEGAGTVEKAGPGAKLTPGTRVAFTMQRGSYAEYMALAETSLVEIPSAVSFEDAAAIMLQGMTAHYLTHSTYKLAAGQTCLIHAASGGAGLLLVQIAKIIGATVIGTVGTEEKARIAQQHGADYVILYEQNDFVREVKKLTSQQGVDVVYDSVGQATFTKSLDCLRPRGMMASFGQSSGGVGEIDPLVLSQKGSLFLTRPSLANYISDPAELKWRSSDLFKWIAEGRLKARVFRTYRLEDAAEAHRDLESRKTSGKLLLEP
jgi:NADPH:quinone reductase